MIRYLVIAALLLLPALSMATERGAELFERHCAWCHGPDGFGDGPASDFLIPPPRDFSETVFKYKSTHYDQYMPTDEDIKKVIRGHDSKNRIWQGTASMPPFGESISEADIEELAGYIKILSGIEEEEEATSIDISGKVSPSAESIKEGKRLFAERERCTECHGDKGRGNAVKRLKDDWGYRTWPRNLTKGWTFRGGSSPEDIYRRITIGIPGTQMPSFANPKNKKGLNEEERWHLANFIASLNEQERVPSEKKVLRAIYTDGNLPDTSTDSAWRAAPLVNLYTAPQIILQEKLYTPSIDSISARAIYNKDEIGLLIEWDDPTESLPLEKKSQKIAGGGHYPDGIAVQFPLNSEGHGKAPYFGEGSTEKPVNIWHWKGAEIPGGTETVAAYIKRGPKNGKILQGSDLAAHSSYEDGRWRLIMKRRLTGQEGETRLMPGLNIPIAFAAWDGSNMESGSRHVFTSWADATLVASKDTGHKRFVWSAVAWAVSFGLLLLWFRKRG